MHSVQETIKTYSSSYRRLMTDKAYARQQQLPSKTFFLEDGSVLALPRDDGDSRYPYGEGGFNFWTYGSGYMHCNEGLFSPFLRAAEGQEPKIAFFLQFKEEGSTRRDVVPILGVPVVDSHRQAKRYTVFSPSATYYFCEVDGVLAALRVFVDRESRVCFTLHVDGKAGDDTTLEAGYYLNPFVKNALVENSVDRWFRQVAYEADEGLGTFVVKAYEEQDRRGMAPNIGAFRLAVTQGVVTDHQVTTSRYDFVGGSRRSLHNPLALIEGKFTKGLKACAFTETAIMGGILSLKTEEPLRVDGVFSYCFDEATLGEMVLTRVDGAAMDKALKAMADHEKVKGQDLSMTFEGDGAVAGDLLTPFMKQVMKQVSFCSSIKGYIQLSSFSLIGVRDIFQALEGVLYYEKDLARAKMLEALNFVTKEGRCPRQYILPKEKGQTHAMDLRPFIDQGVWVLSAIVTYLRYTKDYDFLRVPVGYYEFLDEEKHLARQAEGEGMVLTHMLAIMDYLLANQDLGHTECIYALYGDWNDALDGLGRSASPDKAYGTGVSVMATLQVYQNLEEMIELLTLLIEKNLFIDQGQMGQYKAAKERMAKGLLKYAVVAEGDQKKILHGWGDGRSYLVGSFKDPDGLSRDGLTAGAFWAMTGMLSHDPSLKQVILESFDRLEGKYGLKTFHPHFDMGTEGVGRIPNLPAGTAENGATYIHASLFGVMALFAMGESEKAWQELTKLLPFTHQRISCSPFVMPNSYSFNEAFNIDGESMADWQTGSSNVLLKLMLKYVIGFNPGYKGLTIQPAAYCPFERLSGRLVYQGRQIEVIYHREGVGRTFEVNGRCYEGKWDSALDTSTLWLPDDALPEGDVTIIVRS